MAALRVLLPPLWTLLVLLPPAGATAQDVVTFLMTAPQSPRLQVGANFTATCLIRNTTEVTADDLRWKLAQREIPADRYVRINESALNVTIGVAADTPDWLFCFSAKKSAHVTLNSGKYFHGIFLQKGYLPQKPQKLWCRALQEGSAVSHLLHCEWDVKEKLPPGDFPTQYRLHVHLLHSPRSFNVTTLQSSADINLEVYPNHMTLKVWVEAENELGKVQSEPLIADANVFVKTNPPSDVNIISEETFPTSLLLNWTRPIDETQLKLIYEIRFAPKGSHTWSYVPRTDTSFDIQSFRLQNLRPDAIYVTQVRCKHDSREYYSERDGSDGERDGERDGYWSEWSANATKRTPSSKPSSKPDVWCVLSPGESADARQVQLLSKEPEFANGKIIAYEISVQELKEKQINPIKTAEWETVPVADADADTHAGADAGGSKRVTALKQIQLKNKASLMVRVAAVGLKGKSPVATIVIPETENELPPVQTLDVYSDAGQMVVEWAGPNSAAVSEYLVQWSNGDEMDWQREKRSVRKTAIRGNLEKFVRYSVSVFALYSGRIGKPARLQAYLEQGAPLDGPSVKLVGKPGCTEAHLSWEELPLKLQRGFISNYTIFYSDGAKTQAVTVPSDTFSYTLTSLTRNTRYDVHIRVANVKGAAVGSNHSFTTLKYAPGEVEGIVVGVSLGFLFVVVLTMLICICKRDAIKESFWPQIPNPGASTIGTWAPDYAIKAETSRENALSGISVLDVDVCDGKSVFEEDKACLPLKKDKYMSEEHSSGIGGSSCMSSPRQSVSDSDEGGDMADTTASTVQYSSVVASSGYKGQTPGPPPQVFSRSESTQPLLESEENPDVLSLEGGRQSERFTHIGRREDDSSQLETEAKTLDFCPVGDDPEDRPEGQSRDWSAPMSSYMPQLGGYRPQ